MLRVGILLFVAVAVAVIILWPRGPAPYTLNSVTGCADNLARLHEATIESAQANQGVLPTYRDREPEDAALHHGRAARDPRLRLRCPAARMPDRGDYEYNVDLSGEQLTTVPPGEWLWADREPRHRGRYLWVTVRGDVHITPTRPGQGRTAPTSGRTPSSSRSGGTD